MNTLVVAEQLRRRVPGGIGTYVRGLVSGLEQVGFAPTLWASRAGRQPDPLAELGAPVISVPLPSKLLTRAWDRKLVKPPSGFDVVHATSTAVPPIGKAAMTAMIHDLAWRHFPEAFPPRGLRWHDAALARTIERCRYLFVPSSATADDLVADGVAADRIHVVSEGSDHLPAPDLAGAERLLADNDVTTPFVLTVGTLEPRKNLPRLIEAFSKARSQFDQPTSLVVVGPHGWGESLTPPTGVHAVGSPTMAVIAALYEMCRVFVSVPLMEGYGLPVVEAMRMGAPVVASAVPSAGEATMEVDPLRVDAIADAIVEVANDEVTRNDLVVRGTAHSGNLTWANCATQHLEVWNAL